jgi:hypothetical protein
VCEKHILDAKFNCPAKYQILFNELVAVNISWSEGKILG